MKLNQSFCGVVLLAIASPALAHPHEGISLFDGRTLMGWQSSSDNPTSFSIEDGAIKVNGDRAHLFYVGVVNDAKFKDFEFKAKVKTMPKANSGIYFHTEYQADDWPRKGYECQVNTTHGDEKKTGGL